METVIRTKVKDLLKSEAGKDVLAKGWVRTKRGNKNVAFIALNDGSTINNIQIVVDKTAENEAVLAKVSTGACIAVWGKLVESMGGGQATEIQATAIEVYGECDPVRYPLQKKDTSFEFLRTVAHLRPRTNTFGAIYRVRNQMAYAIHKFFHEKGFVYMHTPLITASDCEGAGQMFRVTTLDMENLPRNKKGGVDYSKDFFGKETSLTVSGQLKGELGAMALGEIYTFGPTFRAENSNTARHAAEFWMIEPEIAFADLNDDMQLAWDMIKHIINHVMDKCEAELAFFNQFVDKGLLERLTALRNADYAKVTYTEAIEVLTKSKADFKFPVYWGVDLQTEHERYLTEQVYKKPIFLIDYPKDIKAFYMRLNDDGKTVAAMDLLVPGVGEIIGGSQREERLDVLQARMAELNLSEEDYWWYLNLRKYGGTKHAGFGLGFERIIMYLTGVSNIRDVIPYPRTVGNAEY